jgi:hypothetical protein
MLHMLQGYLLLCVSGLWKELENMPEIMSSRNKLLKSSISHQRQDMKVLTVNVRRIVHTRAKRNTTIARGWVCASPNYTQQSCGWLCARLCVCGRVRASVRPSWKLLALEGSSVVICDTVSLGTTQPALPFHIPEDFNFSSTTVGTLHVGNSGLWWW